MNKLFDILFLDEAFEFLRNLDKKHYEKFFLIFERLNLIAVLSFSKN
jgi:mRNA-degrading endonuclease RelE of RelBE toxin-antitoxin system